MGQNSQGNMFTQLFNGSEVTPEKTKLLPQGFASLPAGTFTFFDMRKIKAAGLLTVCARFALSPTDRFKQSVDDLFAFLPGLVDQTDIGGVTNVSGGAGGVNIQFSFVVAR